MQLIRSLWNGLLGAWIHIGMGVLPRTIHPMVVHFPIALLYLAVFIQLIGYVAGTIQTSFIQRAGFWVLTMSLFALVGAAAAGVISEQYVRWNAHTASMLSAHQRDAALTMGFAIAAWFVRIFTKYSSFWTGYRTERPFLFANRGRSTIWSDLLLAGAVVLVSVTGSLGGTMVYRYGVGTPPTLVAARHSHSAAAAAQFSSRGAVVIDRWLSYSPTVKVVDLLLHAGVNNNYNFNGYQNGAMTVTVPVGWKVDVSFYNDSSIYSHSAMIVPLNAMQSPTTFTPAFHGASTPHPIQGIAPGGSSHFSFTASQAGNYAIVCDVPGHAALGMWDHMNVAAAVVKPGISL